MRPPVAAGDALRCHVVVRGRVQGVWFRGATEREAKRQGVAGWVRNRNDGSVEAVFEGSRAAVEALLAFVQQGPPYAQVEGVEVRDEPPEGAHGFEVRSRG